VVEGNGKQGDQINKYNRPMNRSNVTPV